MSSARAARILVVEDDAETLDVITLTLEIRGYEVIIGKNGVEGIRQACAEHPDLIITDIKMPRLDGIEMIKELRSRPDCANVPILVITAYDMDLAKEAIRAGANRGLAKPLEPEILHVFIKDLLNKYPHPLVAADAK